MKLKNAYGYHIQAEQNALSNRLSAVRIREAGKTSRASDQQIEIYFGDPTMSTNDSDFKMNIIFPLSTSENLKSNAIKGGNVLRALLTRTQNIPKHDKDTDSIFYTKDELRYPFDYFDVMFKSYEEAINSCAGDYTDQQIKALVSQVIQNYAKEVDVFVKPKYKERFRSLIKNAS